MSQQTKTLVSWIGQHDLDAVNQTHDGPVLATLKAQQFDAIELLYNYPKTKVEPYLKWLQSQTTSPINAEKTKLRSPVHFGDIYEVAKAKLDQLAANNQQLNILLSPGTPAMQAVWILLGKTHYDCTFYQSSKEEGVKAVSIPFELAAEYVPSAEQISSDSLKNIATLQVPANASFDQIIARSPVMKRLKTQATILAERDVPVLIQGDTGTGKELFANAIHHASPRKDQPFKVINCGAIPPELIDSMLFGHKKGAFTGAVSDQAGVFEQADGGTLFLDEFGELTPEVQVRLLRVLQNGEVLTVGAKQPIKVDVRIITATNRDLLQDVVDGKFREDLFYRVAIGLLHLPPLSEREGDLVLLSDYLLAALAKKDHSLKGKKISADAKKVILRHRWPGNIRELHATLMRAALWSRGDMIGAQDIEQAMFNMPNKAGQANNIDVRQGIDLDAVLAEQQAKLIKQALEISKHKKTVAAELLGLNSHQTLDNRMKKLGLN